MQEMLRLSLLVILSVLLNGCAKNTMVVLVPDPDGKTGQITVANQAGKVDINSPNQSTVISDNNTLPSNPAPLEQESINTMFSEALSIQPKRPAHFILYFDKDTALTSESLSLIANILGAIKAQGSADISVIGHTDTVGSKEYNYTLSKRRADSIKDMLVAKGISLSNINTTSHGKENPLIKTEDNVSEPRNRRVEVIIK